MSIGYVLLLLSLVFPHHHHEENICYTNTHCESGDHVEENNVDGLADHHHDHNTSEESEQCFSLEYYVLAAPGKDLKEPVFLAENNAHGGDPLATVINTEYLLDYSGSCDFPYFKSDFTVFVKQHIPLRAPPTTLA